jgi:hypothetical protein
VSWLLKIAPNAAREIPWSSAGKSTRPDWRATGVHVFPVRPLRVNPIPGQEERNADCLLEEGAAVRCNYETTVGYKIAAGADQGCVGSDGCRCRAG